MRRLDLTLPTPAENLALDEALLLDAEAADEPHEVLRLWEPDAPFVVVGRSTSIAAEVDETACQQREIPVLRRTSGGAAIVAGPGCLMYSLVLSYELRPNLRAIDRAHEFVLGTIAAALQQLAPGTQHRGISDLAIGDKKFSGNSVRCKRGHCLYHGTLLYNFPLELIATCLKMPPRQPDYRAGREHTEFVSNFTANRDALREVLVGAFGARERGRDWPRTMMASLVESKYGKTPWNVGGVSRERAR